MPSLIDLPAEDACTLYLLRHGATPPNLVEPPIMQGAGIDEPLAPIGHTQAARVAHLLASRPLKAVYTSPLIRSVETAEAVAKPHGLTVTTVPAIKEVEVGAWEGRTWADVEVNEPDHYAAFQQDPATHGYPGGETLQQLLDRVAPTLEELMARHVGQEIAVAAHSVVNRVYLGSLLGLTLPQGRAIPQANCCLNLVRYRNGKAKVITYNAVTHLM